MNYLNKLLEMGLVAPKGQVTHVTVKHDDHCAIWQGGQCDCDPEVVKGKPEEIENRQGS